MAIYGLSRAGVARALGWERPRNTNGFHSQSTDLAPGWPQLVAKAKVLLEYEQDEVTDFFLVNHTLLSGLRELITPCLEEESGVAKTHGMRRLQKMWIHVGDTPACPHCMLERPGAQRLEWRFALFPYCLSHQVQLISRCICESALVPVDQVIRHGNDKFTERTLNHACRCGRTWQQLSGANDAVSLESLEVQSELWNRLQGTTDPRDRLEIWTGVVNGVAQAFNASVTGNARWYSRKKPPRPAEVSRHLQTGIETANRESKRRSTAASLGIAIAKPVRQHEKTSEQLIHQDLASCLKGAYRDSAIALSGGIPALYPTSLTTPGLTDPLSLMLERTSKGVSRGTWLYNASRAITAMFICTLVTGCSLRQARLHLSVPNLGSRISGLNQMLQQQPDAVDELAKSVVACALELETLRINWTARVRIASSAPAIRAVRTRTGGDLELARYWLVNEYAGRYIANTRHRYAWTHMCSPELVKELHADHELHQTLEAIDVDIAS